MPTICIRTEICLYFFKQKTAYEMRISDWSSNVCSSDLQSPGGAGAVASPGGKSVPLALLVVAMPSIPAIASADPPFGVQWPILACSGGQSGSDGCGAP